MKAGITWKYVTADGDEGQATAELVAGRWVFHSRAGRFDDWIEKPSPSLEDWLEVLDGVRRRIGRHRMDRNDEKLVLERIRKLFPDAEIPR